MGDSSAQYPPGPQCPALRLLVRHVPPSLSSWGCVMISQSPSAPSHATCSCVPVCSDSWELMKHSTGCGGSLVGVLISHSRFLDESGCTALAREFMRKGSQGPGVSPSVDSRTSPQPAQEDRRKTNTNLQSAHGSSVWRGVGQTQRVPKNPSTASTWVTGSIRGPDLPLGHAALRERTMGSPERPYSSQTPEPREEEEGTGIKAQKQVIKGSYQAENLSAEIQAAACALNGVGAMCPMNWINYSKAREILLLPEKPLSSLLQTPLTALPAALKLGCSCKPNPKYNTQARDSSPHSHLFPSPPSPPLTKLWGRDQAIRERSQGRCCLLHPSGPSQGCQNPSPTAPQGQPGAPGSKARGLR